MSLKLSNNKISGSISSLLDTLKPFTNLKKLDLSRNDVCGKEVDSYREKVFGILKELEVLDGQDRDGFSVASDDEEEGEDHLHDYGEDGEESLNNLLAGMDEETR